jgi:digeranylgeranylglycerophospholipid reductase
MNNSYDIIVVGAGPAGSAAAFTAAELGASVLLLEEHEKIGVPVQCAEGIARSTVKGYVDVKPEWISTHLSGCIIRSPDGEEFRITYPDVGWILDRTKFDPGLAQMAKDRGAAVKTNAKAIGVQDSTVIVREETAQKAYTFKILIGADGIASRVGRWMGIDTRLGPYAIEVCAACILEGVTVDTNYIRLIFGHTYAPGGYAWVFPKSPTSVNVGLGIAPPKTKKKAYALLKQLLHDEFPDAVVQTRIFGGVPSRILRRFSGKNFYLVGDAARFTDPVSGAGIANGVRSGVIAARNAVSRLHGEKDTYEKEIKQLFLNEIVKHLRIRNFYIKLGDDEYNEVFRIARRLLGSKTIHTINITDVVREIVLSSPRLLKMGLGRLLSKR